MYMKIKLKFLTIALLAVSVATIFTSLKITGIDAQDMKGGGNTGRLKSIR
jgi:hypothetical protein